MNVLVSCEYSGTTRDAFLALGHNAWSCDILPTDVPGPHFQQPVEEVLHLAWDLIIAHPPCTDLASSGAQWWPAKRADGRQQAAIEFFMLHTRQPCRWAIENPIGLMSSVYRKPDQVIQPWQFGHEITKSTCLWLSGLPLLQSTEEVGKGERVTFSSGKSMPAWYNLSPSPTRWKQRSTSFTGIAAAMAAQWGHL